MPVAGYSNRRNRHQVLVLFSLFSEHRKTNQQNRTNRCRLKALLSIKMSCDLCATTLSSAGYYCRFEWHPNSRSASATASRRCPSAQPLAGTPVSSSRRRQFCLCLCVCWPPQLVQVSPRKNITATALELCVPIRSASSGLEVCGPIRGKASTTCGRLTSS